MIGLCEVAIIWPLIAGHPADTQATEWASTMTLEEAVPTVFKATDYDDQPWQTWAPHIVAEIRDECGTPAPSVHDIVDAAADEFGIARAVLQLVVHCESTHRPDARNPERTRFGHALGLGQHLEDLWGPRAVAIGLPFDADPFDAENNARVTAWLISTQGMRPYLASISCHGMR